MSNDIYGEEFAGDFIEHFGVKGMKWGRRKAEGTSAAAPSSNPKKLTSKERKFEEVEFYNQKIGKIVFEALSDPDVLIKTRLQGSSYPTVVTGREFVDFVSRSGAFDASITEVYARKDGAGPYIVNDAIIGEYKRGK